jgi:hypothetical protein
MIRALTAQPRQRLVAAALVLIVAGVHFQQYVAFMSQIPTVGVLFLLNAAGGAGIALALVSPEHNLRRLASLGAVGLCLGSLASIAIALQSSFFGYAEPSLRLPIVIAIVAEVAALLIVARELTARPGSPST